MDPEKIIAEMERWRTKVIVGVEPRAVDLIDHMRDWFAEQEAAEAAERKNPEERRAQYLAEIKRQADLISDLLADPQPGLMTWCLAYGDAMNRIAELWKKGA